MLKNWGLEFHRFENIETGGYCEIGEGPALLFRSDIDALPIEEDRSHTIISENKDVMHACGHDYHTAIGLGLCRYFQQNRDKLKGQLRVIFQPAEEAAPGGAEFVIEENIWQNAKNIVGVHVDNEYPAGQIILPKKTASASSTSMKIVLQGPGGHTSRPDETVDLVHVCGQYVTHLKSHLLNSTDPRTPLSFAFGQIQGGHTHNSIPQKILLQGTLRTHSNQMEQESRQIIKSFTKNFANLNNIKIMLEFPTNCPAAINDENMVQIFSDYMQLQLENQNSSLVYLDTASMGADDFAVYLRKIPGLYLRVGAGGRGEAHTGNFLLEEDLLKPAMHYLSGFIQYYFNSIK